MWDKILCIVAHPDDDVIGAGSFIAGLIEHANATVMTLYLSNGVGSREDNADGEVEKRMEAMEKANGILGVQLWEVGLFEDQRFDQYPIIELTKYVERFVEDFKPTTVITHSSADLNRDHKCVHEAVMTACRPVPGKTVQMILCMEVASATEWGDRPFKPTCFFGGNHVKKQEALKAYGAELRPMPHARNEIGIMGKMVLRGNSVGALLAEAFELERWVMA